MYKIPLDDLKQKIIATGKYDATTLNDAIHAKISELSGLISEEGATHILANECGVELENKTPSNEVKVNQVKPGMRDLVFHAKIIRMYEMREFTRNERTGKVQSLFVGDETGTTRLVFWNDQVDQLKDVKEGMVLKVTGAYARENRGNSEVHLGDGSIEIAEGVEISVATQSYSRKKITELQANDSVQILGTVVQVFDPRFFALCPQCNKRAKEENGTYNCLTHGAVEPKMSYVLNAVLDDGTSTIRGVFWKEQTNQLLSKQDAEFLSYKDDLTQFESAKESLFGEQFKLEGRVKQNDLFNRLEFVVQTVAKAQPQEEIV